MPTTAGSIALEGSIPPRDAFITAKLRAAGAIILGKATLTAFANFIAIGMPTGYSSLGGFGFNPYYPVVDPRTTPPLNDGRPARIYIRDGVGSVRELDVWNRWVPEARRARLGG